MPQTIKPNNIKIYRHIDGHEVVAYATYCPSVDGWECSVKSHYGHEETRTPDQTGNDVWATLVDMIELALDVDRKKTAPFQVMDLGTDELHGRYATLAEARGAVCYDKLRAYAIWNGDIRVEFCEPYEGDDDRVRQALGEAPWEQPS